MRYITENTENVAVATPKQLSTVKGMAARAIRAGRISRGHYLNVLMAAKNVVPAAEARREITRLRRILSAGAPAETPAQA